MSNKQLIGKYLADNAEIISDTFHQSGESPKAPADTPPWPYRLTLGKTL